MPTAIAIPTRGTIDVRADVAPSHAWIIGAMPKPRRRADVLGVVADGPGGSGPSVATAISGEISIECCCPEFCELDHANE